MRICSSAARLEGMWSLSHASSRRSPDRCLKTAQCGSQPRPPAAPAPARRPGRHQMDNYFLEAPDFGVTVRQIVGATSDRVDSLRELVANMSAGNATLVP